jgi:hypothetical protein
MCSFTIIFWGHLYFVDVAATTLPHLQPVYDAEVADSAAAEYDPGYAETTEEPPTDDSAYNS